VATEIQLLACGYSVQRTVRGCRKGVSGYDELGDSRPISFISAENVSVQRLSTEMSPVLILEQTNHEAVAASCSHREPTVIKGTISAMSARNPVEFTSIGSWICSGFARSPTLPVMQ
jgi:hypothetical protein